MRKVVLRILSRVGVLFAAAVVFCDVGHVFNIQPPAAPHLDKIVSCEQQWTTEKASWFHTVSQGTMIMPVEWFLNLEQPEVRAVTTPLLLCDPDYLRRFGFIYEDAESRSPALPIGFALEENFRDPHFSTNPEQTRETVVGLTCAACHTGQLNYRGIGIRIEGAPGNVDLGLFQKAVGRSLAFTLYVPCRFERFAKRVLKSDYDDASRKKLKVRFREFVKSKLHAQLYADSRHLYDLKGGNGRTDALALIGNRTFQDLSNPDNLEVTSAPVNFPPLWDAPWFDWVQYNASIGPPMVRNIGEALGVGAMVVTNPEAGQLYDSTVNVRNLHAIEKSLAGEKPFDGLIAPTWPAEILGALEPDKVAAGRAVYAAHCKGCHPLTSELRQSHDEQDNHTAWTKASGDCEYVGSRLMRLAVFNLRQIGTDPAQALNMHRRVVQTPSGTLSEGEALMQVTLGVRAQIYRELNLTDEQKEFDSNRGTVDGDPNTKQKSQIIADNLGYRSRPLDGVWATAPYLHNGSVPTLYDLLVPVERRPKSFYVGGGEFDIEKVGFLRDNRRRVFFFDATVPGNLNQGHEFRNLTLEELERFHGHSALRDPDEAIDVRWAKVLAMALAEYQSLSKNARQERIRKESAKLIHGSSGSFFAPAGLLGAELKDADRWSLIEYLKSL